MKTILFVPTYWHASMELFSLLIDKLGANVQKILLESGDPHFNRFGNNDAQASRFARGYDHMHCLDFPESLKRNFRSIYGICKYQQKFRNIFEVYNPDIIITSGDRNHFYHLLRSFKRKDVPILVLQEALISVKYYQDRAGQNYLSKTDGPHTPPTEITARKDFSKIPKTDGKRISSLLKICYHKVFGIEPFLNVDYSKGWGLHDPHNYLLLWGPLTAKLFDGHRENIYCLGNPLIDDIYHSNFNTSLNTDLCRKLGCNPSKKTVLISTTCLSDIKDSSEVLTWYNALIESCYDRNIVIKIHPRDGVGNFDSLRRHPNTILIKNEHTYRRLMEVSSVSISHYSATTIEAVAYGLPVILLPLTAVSAADRDHWFASPIFFKPGTVAECIEVINMLLAEPYKGDYETDRSVYLKDMFSENIGNATNKIINKVSELMNTKV